MPRFDLECTYCGHKWRDSFWNKEYMKNITCPNGKCNDKNIYARELEEDVTNDVFGYRYKPKPANKTY